MVRQAQAQLDLLKPGARSQDIAAAEAAVAQAEAARQQALAGLADTELRAPFAGTVAVLHVRQGEQVAAGTPVAEIGDSSTWQVETDDLSELDIVRVQPGADGRPDLRRDPRPAAGRASWSACSPRARKSWAT